MEHKFWFRTKRYGWGWTPISWEGWTIVIFFVLFLVWDFLRIDAVSHSNSDTLRPFLIQMILASIVLVAISYWKGER